MMQRGTTLYNAYRTQRMIDGIVTALQAQPEAKVLLATGTTERAEYILAEVKKRLSFDPRIEVSLTEVEPYGPEVTI